jgi:hypothetical protein
LSGEGRAEAVDSGEREPENLPLGLKFKVSSLYQADWSGLALSVTLV